MPGHERWMVFYKRGYSWVPQYTTDRGTSYDILEVSAEVCPVCVATPELNALIDLETRNRHVKDATGATMWGPDSGRWPAWWFDVVAVIEVQRILEHNARVKAEMSEVERRR